jgi:peptidoglycan/xylan/chitin deacetylase (PgdA/CDA1 family)
VTVDDLPMHGPDTLGMSREAIADRFLDAFRRHGVNSAYGFVNGKKVADDPTSEGILRRWRAAGHPLGNHTYSHVSLNALDLSEYLPDVEKGEAILEKLVPDRQSWKVFRYPFLYEGDTLDKRDGVRRYLHDHGYLVAPVTIDADDWAYNPPFSRCAAQKDAASLATLRRGFLEAHVEELRRMRELSQALVQRRVPQILLLHIGAADADAIDDLLTLYEKEGARWIDLGAALADPFYALDSGAPARYGAALPYRLAKARGMRTKPPVFARTLEDDLAKVCVTR